MSLLIFAYRRQDIIRRKSDLNMKLLELNQKIMDLQSYTATVANGTVSLNDLVNAPATMFGPMSIFMMTTNQAAYAGASEKFAVLSQMGAIQQAQTPQLQQQYNAYIMNQLQQQEREKMGKVEEKRLNAMDKQIEQQKAKIETQLKMLDAEEESVKQGEEKGAKDSAPKYVA